MNAATLTVPVSRTIAPGLVARDVLVTNVTTTKLVTSLSISYDGKYLAIGDAGGRVTLRDLENSGRLVVILNAGKDVGITCMAWLRGERPWSLFIASGNGYLNCYSFHDGDLEATNPKPRNSAVKVPGHITCLSINDDSTQIAVSYDQTTKIFPLPFTGAPKTATYGKDSGFLINQEYGPAVGVPVRSLSRAVGLHYIEKHTLCVAFFASIKAYDTNPASPTRGVLWKIVVPDTTNIGSCALSPSRSYIVATNLKDGTDWYSTKSREYISKTRIQDSYDTNNRVLPVKFLTDTTFIAGNNSGRFVTGTNGVEQVRYHGIEGAHPLQHLAVSTTQGKFQVAHAVGSVVTATAFLFDKEAEEVKAPAATDLIDLSPDPAPKGQAKPTPPTTALVPLPVPEVEAGRNNSGLETRGPRPSTLPPFDEYIEGKAGTTPPSTRALIQPRKAVGFADVPSFHLRDLGGGEPSGSAGDFSLDARHIFGPGSNVFSTPAGRSTEVFRSFHSREGLDSESFVDFSELHAESTPARTNSMTLSPMDRRGPIGSMKYTDSTGTLGAALPRLTGRRQPRFGTPRSQTLAKRGHGENDGQAEEKEEEEEEEEEEDGDGEGDGDGDGEGEKERVGVRVRVREGEWTAKEERSSEQQVGSRAENEVKTIIQAFEAVNAAFMDACTMVKRNPLVASVVLLSVAVFVGSSILAKGVPRDASQIVGVPSVNIGQNDGLEGVVLEEEDEMDDDQGPGFDGGLDTVIITETKVLTVTRTVTATVTSTATVTTGLRPKRTPRSRGRRQ